MKTLITAFASVSLIVLGLFLTSALNAPSVAEPATAPGQVTTFHLDIKQGQAVPGVKLISNVGASLQG